MKKYTYAPKKYWVFIDDSGNIELSSPDKYFIYAALIFDNEKDVKKFCKDYIELINKYFNYELKKYSEIKGKHRITWKKRKLIYDLIINSNCKLVAVIEEKNKSKKLKDIEMDYNISLNFFGKLPFKAKLGLRKLRKDQYGYHKSYLISEIICIYCRQILYFKKNSYFIIKSDIEYLVNPGISNDIVDYMSNHHKFLKWFYNAYDFTMGNSKQDYCLQGADFLAHAVYKLYNDNERRYFDYINDKKQIYITNLPFDANGTEIKILDNRKKNDNI